MVQETTETVKQRCGDEVNNSEQAGSIVAESVKGVLEWESSVSMGKKD